MYTSYGIGDYLSHSGVKGMHWGQRKEEEDADPELSEKAASYAKDYKAYKKTKALCVCGKAKKADVAAAKEKAKKSADAYRQHYFKLKSKKREASMA